MSEQSIRESRLVYLTCFLFFACYIIIGYYNRLSHDDLAYLYGVNSDGVINSTLHNFNSWNTRWAGVFASNLVFSFLTIHSNLLWFHLLSLVVLVISAGCLINSLSMLTGIEINSRHNLLVSFNFTVLFFVCTFSIGDVWYWINASCMYLWNVSFFIAGLAVALAHQPSAFYKLLLVICGLYTGGSSEPFAVISLLFLSVCAGVIYASGYPKSISYRIILLTGTIMAGFLISCSGRGMDLRSSALPDPGFAQKQFIFLKSLVKFFLFHFPAKLAAAFILSIPTYLIGNSFSESLRIKTPFISILKIILIVFVLIVSATFYVIVFKMAEAGPERAWTVISFYMAVAVALAAFTAGLQKKFSFLHTNARAILIITSSGLVLFSIWQGRLLSGYASEYDKRVSSVADLAKKNYSGTAYLKPLPPSGILHSGEITADSNHFTNYHFKQFFNLPFPVVLDTSGKSGREFP